ncbi:uncharacterized protein K02A2.6-like [Acropora millepora]|uniref:uncharacterized protein K02A2.6-like n=1 Tax=Acropora millepora TaxID=45264 RepID=UPI001CF5A395|nr:uncharacterized protein K02A2.6-like [Acropora millepora]
MYFKLIKLIALLSLLVWKGFVRSFSPIVWYKGKIHVTELMIPTPLPERPWQKVATDLFYHSGKTYIIVVDYYSRFFEIAPLKSTTTENAINHLKSFFRRHGIPDITISDNGPQFAAATFSKFAEEWGFTHLTSSPQYPQSDGEVGRAVNTAKGLIIKSEDPYMALLSYRSTPLVTP